MAVEYSLWWPLSSWISPGAALFLFCNALVGAIVVMSSRGEQGASTRRLCRSASSMVLGRLRSFIFSGHPVPGEDGYHPSMEMGLVAEAHQPQPSAAEPAIPTAPASAPAAAPSATATTASSESAVEVAEVGEDKPVILEEAQGPACQGHAHKQPPPPPAAVTVAAAEVTAAAESIMHQARAYRRELVEEAFEGKAALNARAEMFIRQFKEDLKLQRLNSIINYTRALRRGAGSAPAAGE